MAEPPLTDRLHVRVEGLVQGVGFRYATYRKATSLRLKGWVRNLADGRVEAEFEGPKPVLEEMLAWCREGPMLSDVRRVATTWAEGPGGYDSFDIRF